MIKILLSLFLSIAASFGAVGSWNGVAFTALNGVAQTAWNGTTISCAAGTFAPTSLPNLVLWLDGNDATKIFTTSALSTAVTADSDPVGGWKDKSTQGNDFIQATTGNRAAYRTGANGRNSKSVIQFNGTSSFLQKTMASLSTQTIFAVITDTSSSGSGYGGIICHGADSHGMFIKRNAGPVYQFDFYTGSDNDSGNITPGNWSLFTADVSGSGTFNAWLNQSQFKTAAAGFSSVIYDNIGSDTANERLTGSIAELIIYSDVKNGTDRGSVETYLISKWGTFP